MSTKVSVNKKIYSFDLIGLFKIFKCKTFFKLKVIL